MLATRSVERSFAAVTLISFSAIGQPDHIEIIWETASELDNAGFYINRSTQQTGNYERISPFIPGEGDSITGAIYSYLDFNATSGVTFWYKLESIDFNQNSTFFDQSVSAVAGSQGGGTATQTSTPTGTITPPTATRTSTPTITGTILPGTSTVTPTRTATSPATTPTRTATLAGAYPAPATATVAPFATSVAPTAGASSGSTPVVDGSPTPPAVQEPGGVVSATATLVPVPELALQFPEQTDVQVGGSETPNPPEPDNIENQDQGWLTPGRVVFIVFILVVWILLGGWFYLSMRRVE